MSSPAAHARVVVGVDGSPNSVAALRLAARLAPALGASLRVVTVWSYPPLADFYVVSAWSPEADARKALDAALAEAFGATPPEGLISDVVAGPVTPALIEESTGAAMLVLGSRGWGGFVGLLLGSVSAACAEHAHCPVLIVHPTEAATETT